MYVMLQTLDDHKPTRQDRLTTPGAVPDETKRAEVTASGTALNPPPPSPPLFLSLSFTGMVIRPKADETFEIVYTIQKTESWDMYAQALDKFLGRKFGLIVALLTSVEHLVLC